MALSVESLPNRTAHAVSALIKTRELHSPGPWKAADVCAYDAPFDGFMPSPRRTAAALRHAQRLGLARFVKPHHWVPTAKARRHSDEFKKRFIQDEERALGPAPGSNTSALEELLGGLLAGSEEKADTC
jgi:hypothetical protein